ncbi:MAG: cyclopropane-fatty-acyl-phospholipid synthase family protein [Vicinamibacterales bacterium]
MGWTTAVGKRLFLEAAAQIRVGTLELVCPDRTYTFKGSHHGPSAMMVVHDERVFGRALRAGDRGLGEAYVDGDWSAPDLVALLRVALRNGHAFARLNGGWSWVARQASRLTHRLRSNTRGGSRRNIAAHYDIGRDFFALFLDRDLVYSAAWFEHATDTLEQAQRQKLDRICRKLGLRPEHHLLEIGTGWGALAEHAAVHYGCRVTTTTIGQDQHDYSRDRFAALGEAGRRITLLFDDYRDVRGTFDRIVSVEMFEAVGLAHYDDFFTVCDRSLVEDGSALLQVITIGEQDFQRSYRGSEDWMQSYVFPGSELACLSEILRSLGRVTALRPFHLEDLGAHYARTLGEWRRRFHERRDAIARLGIDEAFLRTWDLYLAYSQAGFAERHISDVQLLLTRAYHDARYPGEPDGLDVAWGSRAGALPAPGAPRR